MDQEQLDEIQAEESSPSAASESVASQTDENQTATDTSTDSTQDSTEPKTVEDVVNKVFKAHQTADEQENAEAEKTVEELEGKTDKEETEKDPSETEETQEKESQEAPDKGPVPYKRFEEVNTAKNELEERVRTIEPLAKVQQEIADFCMDNGISGDDFRYLMQLGRALKNDPEEAMKLLEPHVRQLQAYKGEILPPDLIEAVGKGHLTEEYAKMIAASRNQNALKTQQLQRTQEQHEQRQQMKFYKDMQTTLSAWNRTKMSNDPDMRPAKPGGPRGKYEIFIAMFEREVKGANLTSTADAKALADKIYAELNSFYKKGSQSAKPPAKPVVKSTSSTVNGKHSPPKTALEVAQQVAARHGIR